MLNYGPALLIVFSVFLGILLNRREVTSLKEDMNKQFERSKEDMNKQFQSSKEDMNKQFERVDRRLTLIENDQKQFFQVTGKMDGRIDELSRGR